MASELKSSGFSLPLNASGDQCFVSLKLHSPGIFANLDAVSEGFRVYFQHPLPNVLVQQGLIFFLTQIFHLVLRRLLLPRLVSEILVGILLGPSGLGQIPILKQTLFNEAGGALLELLAKIGYVFFIFLSGVKMDPKLLLMTGTKPWFIGLLSVLIPSGASLLFMPFYVRKLHANKVSTFKSIMLIQNLYSFPVVATMLYELKVINSELGRLALSSALISDFASNIFVTTVYHGRLSRITPTQSIYLQSAFLTIFLVVMIISVGVPFCRWIVMCTPEGEPVRNGYVTILIIVFMVIFLLTDNIGLHYMYGPFILGLVIPDGPPLGSTLVDRFETLILGFFAPLFVTYCGMQVNLALMYDMQVLSLVAGGIGLCLAIKLVGTFIVSMGCKVPLQASAALALVMSSQGVVHMSFYFQDVVNQTYGRGNFSRLVMVVLMQAVVSHPIARILYRTSKDYAGSIRRDISHATISGLRVVTCAYRLEEVAVIKKVFQNSFSTAESPLTIYALHLVELAGRAHPQMIDHQLGQKSASDSRTQQMMDTIASLAKEHEGFIMVEQFTAVSLTKFMHHDICSLAFNKVASLVILPFHRKWNHQGQLVDDNGSVRATNNEVLESAPCSVGILIDRSKISSAHSAKYNVGMPFFGGEDDREALAFVIHMLRSPWVCLVIIRFIPWNFDWESQSDMVKDHELLNEVRAMGQERDNVVYKEERVKDGAESALIIHEMEDVCDLMVIGRHHKEELPQLSGLSEWNDLPELGPIGDILAAPDLTKPVSVLVLQHQKVAADDQEE